MTTEQNFTHLSEKDPEILLQTVNETKDNIWFWQVACPVTRENFYDICSDVYQRSHDAIRIDVSDVGFGVLTIRHNPTVPSDISLQEVRQRLVGRLCDAYDAKLSSQT